MSVTCLYTLADIDAALAGVAAAIDRDFSDCAEPIVVLVIMKGALVTAGALLPKLTLPIEVDYVHATRYQGNEPASELTWLHRPQVNLAGRRVLLVDDILDQGITLAEVREYCINQGADKVKSMVLARKVLAEPAVINADYEALTVPDQYVFGFGMDDRELSRNLPGIYVKSTS
ncbi:hypoxanthine-guanine phosphoribosyltransferase [Gilvimarinus sp. 1_MG-2023]|uniref:hypoxanthine-guanine phosphoribosyltransferase n=1 Tax=Gilvimarinus sp. 1_MG-2023 TaxID=3062638 RepID=UPI0026E2F3F4|nr:hypoxanthine-guanine phosphoribosyltransferase [Gilvimarinus sp. 1_MG-2023]MDO6747299.1 hypoxanthine-guanine phosphoribosyltransferase [Gilvimarinus sp. 1_MG-2023]